MVSKMPMTVLSLWLCLASAAGAEPTTGRDPIAEALISPDIVMSHQQALRLNEAQRNAIEADVQAAQQRFTRLQWQLAAASEKLVGLVKQSHVDQAKALSALDAELDLEREIKHTQLTLMIQVKNELTPEQQTMARQFAAARTK
jgi:Spy/CpxP family protein refolding chaperone